MEYLKDKHVVHGNGMADCSDLNIRLVVTFTIIVDYRQIVKLNNIYYCQGS